LFRDEYDYEAAIEASLLDRETVEVEMVSHGASHGLQDDVEEGPLDSGGIDEPAPRLSAVVPPVSTSHPPTYDAIFTSKRSSFGLILETFGKALTPKHAQTKPQERKTLTYTDSIHVPKKAVAFLDKSW